LSILKLLRLPPDPDNEQMKHKPDFNEFKNYLLGKQKASRLHIADLLIDDDILKQYTIEILKQTWIDREDDLHGYLKNYVDCYRSMGFDYVPVHFWIQNTFRNFPQPETWIAHDKGLITSDSEYDNFPWKQIYVDYSCLDILTEYLPERMKIVAVTGDLQDLMDCLVGTVSFMMMIYDNPELLDKLINRWYAIKLQLFETVLRYDSVGAVFSCADMGSSHSTLVSPDFIQAKLMPWYKKFSDTAHEHDKMYWFHSCGDIYSHKVIDMLIDDVGIDAFHSFQDSICPVTEFLDKYGEKTAALGGIDLDKLCRLDASELRTYIRSTIRKSLNRGRYAIGTGNSVPDYVPFRNWLILLEEAEKFNL